MKACAFMMAAAVAWPISSAVAAGGAGQAVAVTDNANALGQGGTRTLAVGTDVFVGDTVKTDASGEAQILFNDGTRMVVGSGSTLVIDEALFRGQASENKFAVRALGGAFRFISGDTDDKNYRIRTPSATIGVRGTALDFIVYTDENGQIQTKVLGLQVEGDQVTVCDEDETDDEEECKTIAAPCVILQTEDEEDVKEVGYDPKNNEKIQEEFPYAKKQDHLNEEFRIAGAPCVLGGLAAAAAGSTVTAIGVGVGIAAIVGIIIAITKNNSNNNTNNN